MATLQFLTRVGKMCTDTRQEFILLSDVLGVSALVDAINNPKIGGSTENSVLGPFFTEDAPESERPDDHCACCHPSLSSYSIADTHHSPAWR